jgi:hypothetical protein
MNPIRTFVIPALCLLAAGATTQGLKGKKWEFAGGMKKAQEAFDGKKYGACMTELKTALSETGKLRAAAILASFPAAPAGYQAQEVNTDMNAFGMFGFGSEIKRDYRRGEEAVAHFTVMADSPVVAVMQQMIANPALLAGDKNAELVSFGAHKGILRINAEEKSGKLELLIHSAHLLTVEWNGLGRTDVEPLLEEELVKKIADALAN